MNTGHASPEQVFHEACAIESRSKREGYLDGACGNDAALRTKVDALLAADAEAYQIEVASMARADAIRREAEALKDNPALIQLRIAEKWDGKLPQFSGGNVIPFLNLDSIRSE